MQSTKPPYTSIRNVPAGTILGNSGGATAAAQALDASTVRTVIGLGTAATAAAGDFEPAGSIAALSSVYQPLDSDLTAIAALSTTTYGRALLAMADAAAGRSALGLAGLSIDANGVASLTGSAAAYRAYGPNTNYLALSHNGTLGNINNPTGDVVLSASNIDIARVRSETAAGITLHSRAFLAFSSTTSPNGSFDTVIGRYGAGIALAGTAFGALRYGWDGTNGVIQPSAGSLNVDVATGSSLKVRRSDITTRFVTINPDFGDAGTQINSWGRLELEASNGSSPLYLRGSRVIFNNVANTSPVSLIGTTDLLTVYNGGGTVVGTFEGILKPAAYTFATVPSASSNTGSTIRITDRAQRQAYSDGTNWRFTADDVIIS